jgi:apolipoprotein N-acyltransferase
MRTSTDFLVNITNDGWFGESAAQWQHAFAAAFRAVENRVPLVRCSNNGLTCWFDAWGRMRELLLDEKGSVYGAGFLRCEVPVQAPGQKRALTFYARHGDWFGWSCAAMAGLVLAIGLWRHRRWSQSRVEVL